MPISEIIAFSNGERLPNQNSLNEAMALANQPGDLVWIRVANPNPEELQDLAERLDIHDLALEDAITAHQRSKIERYGNMLFVVLHAAKYDEATEKLQTAEIHAWVGPNYVVTIRQTSFAGPDVIIDRLAMDEDFAKHESLSILHALLDTVVDEYQPIVSMIEADVDQVQDQLFDDAADPSSQRIYELLREVITFQRMSKSLRNIAQELESGRIFRHGPRDFSGEPIPGADDPELRLHWRDVADHTISAADRTDDFRQALENALTVHSTLVAQDQNEEMKRMTETSIHQADVAKKVSGWAAILFFPTLVAGTYGMNFEHMPELGWMMGYPFALGLMLLGVVTLYLLFKRSDWI